MHFILGRDTPCIPFQMLNLFLEFVILVDFLIELPI